MARGHEDWGLDSTAFGNYSQDISELAARMGSIAVWSRSGRVVFIDDFDTGPFNWISSTAGTGSDILTEQDFVHQGLSAVKLVCGTSLADAAQISKYYRTVFTSNLGVEFFYSSNSTKSNLFLTMTPSNETERYQFQIEIDDFSKSIHYINSSGVRTSLVSLDEPTSGSAVYNNFKLIIDPVNFEYVKLIIGNRVYDMSGLGGAQLVGGLTYPAINIQIKCASRQSVAGEMYIDNFIYTVDEP